MEKLNGADFGKVFRVMEKSFPLDEYRTFEEQKNLLGEDAYQIYVLHGDDGESVIAFMAVWEWQKLLFIEHFAVDPSQRNRGIGKRMLHEIVSANDKIVCLEVELPDTEIAVRRIGFYKRCGFFLNEYPYMQPSISKGRSPIPLQIMTYGRAVSKDEFAEIRDTLYTHVYKQL